MSEKPKILKLEDYTYNQKSSREGYSFNQILQSFNNEKDTDFRTLTDTEYIIQNMPYPLKWKEMFEHMGKKLQKQIDKILPTQNLTITRNTYQYENRCQANNAEVLEQIQIVKNKLDQVRISREESAESLSEQIDSKINKFSYQLLVEQKVRLETQGKYVIQDVYEKLQQKVNFEKGKEKHQLRHYQNYQRMHELKQIRISRPFDLYNIQNYMQTYIN